MVGNKINFFLKRLALTYFGLNAELEHLVRLNFQLPTFNGHSNNFNALIHKNFKNRR